MFRLGRFLGVIMFITGVAGMIISFSALIYVVVKKTYELKFLQITLDNPDAQLLIGTIIFFLIGISGFSIFNRYDILLNYEKYKKN